MSETFGLDLQKGAQLCRTEMYGDWYRDPWEWAEITWAKEEPSKIPITDLVSKTGEGIVARFTPEFSPLHVPKSLLGIRPAVVMTPDAHLLYLASIAAVAPKLHANLPEWVFGWRIRDTQFITRNADEWRSYLSVLEQHQQGEWALKTDITSFFASIDADRAETHLLDKLGKSAPATIAVSILRAHDALSSFSGLPQRSYGSAIIANSLLQPVDDLIAHSIASGRIPRAVRWMDDIHIHGAEGELFALNVELHQRMRQLGLELNASKSGLLPAAELADEFELEKVEEIETPQQLIADVSGLGYVSYDTSQILGLEERILADPQSWSRHVVRLVLRGLRENYEFDSVQQWLEIAPKLPHHADLIGRYLRDAVHFPFGDLSSGLVGEWLNEYLSGPWSTLSWVKAQAALTFDSSGDSSSSIKGRLIEWLEHSSDLQLVAIAIQRLGSMEPSLVRDITRARVDAVTSPLMLRNFALGLMAANEESRFVMSILQRDPRNLLLLKMIDSRGYRALKVANDFDQTRSDQ
ncbi:RNA-directed DNA polymerase [Nonomuraea zeae]|uniref:RNA-directed DNA polymerase n=1 Tax=Nonomuraea zeae TaxID=1642303 RepID=A0A5S4GYP8_9ACTN|nr:RNA-directed DNA polymerase [Nonomuraea zeae]TMR38093.1 RNA-directed DNA polymerase [Nonomuraea zeae]